MGYEKRKRKRSLGKVEAMPIHDWEIEEDLRAVARAKAVEGDPERMKKVRSLAKDKLSESMRKKEEAQRLIDLGQAEAK